MTIINLLYILVYHANSGAPGFECLLVLIGFFECAALYSFTRSIPNRLAISSPLIPPRFSSSIWRRSEVCEKIGQHKIVKNTPNLNYGSEISSLSLIISSATSLGIIDGHSK